MEWEGSGHTRTHLHQGVLLITLYCLTAHLGGFMTSGTSMACVTRDVICVLRKFRRFKLRFDTDFLQKAPVRWINGENRLTAFVDSVFYVHTDNTT
jgi:hypothetical protein